MEILRACSGRLVGLAVARRHDRHGVADDADGKLRRLCPDRLDAETMGEIGVMGRVKCGLHVALARRMDAEQMRQDHRAPRLVEGRHRIEPVAQAADDGLRVALEGISRRARRPATVPISASGRSQ